MSHVKSPHELLLVFLIFLRNLMYDPPHAQRVHVVQYIARATGTRQNASYTCRGLSRDLRPCQLEARVLVRSVSLYLVTG